VTSITSKYKEDNKHHTQKKESGGRGSPFTSTSKNKEACKHFLVGGFVETMTSIHLHHLNPIFQKKIKKGYRSVDSINRTKECPLPGTKTHLQMLEKDPSLVESPIEHFRGLPTAQRNGVKGERDKANNLQRG